MYIDTFQPREHRLQHDIDIDSNDTFGAKNHVNGNRSDRSSTSALRRSHSQSNVNKPSQDLLGLTLHHIATESIDIDVPGTSNELQKNTIGHESDNNGDAIKVNTQNENNE